MVVHFGIRHIFSVQRTNSVATSVLDDSVDSHNDDKPAFALPECWASDSNLMTWTWTQTCRPNGTDWASTLQLPSATAEGSWRSEPHIFLLSPWHYNVTEPKPSTKAGIRGVCPPSFNWAHTHTHARARPNGFLKHNPGTHTQFIMKCSAWGRLNPSLCLCRQHECKRSVHQGLVFPTVYCQLWEALNPQWERWASLLLK